MKGEPVLTLGLIVAIGIALLQSLGAGTIDSADDIVSIVLPIIGAAIARSQVTPVP